MHKCNLHISSARTVTIVTVDLILLNRNIIELRISPDNFVHLRYKIIGVFRTKELDPDVTFIEPDGDRVGRGQFDLYLVSHAARTRLVS